MSIRPSALENQLLTELKNLYSIKEVYIQSLPEMLDAAWDNDLRKLLMGRLAAAKSQLIRLDTILEGFGHDPGRGRAAVVEEIVRETSELIMSPVDNSLKDAGLLAAARRVAHYQMALYESVRAYAEILGYYEFAGLLDSSFEEELDADDELASLTLSLLILDAEDGMSKSRHAGHSADEEVAAGHSKSYEGRW